MSQLGILKKLHFDQIVEFEQTTRRLLASSEEPLRAMLQFMKDKYIDDKLMPSVVVAILAIEKLKKTLAPAEKKPNKWDQLALLQLKEGQGIAQQIKPE